MVVVVETTQSSSGFAQGEVWMDIKLKTTPQATKGAIFDVPVGQVAFDLGPNGPDTFLCGNCGNVLARGMGGSIKVTAVTIRCNVCRAFNEAPS